MLGTASILLCYLLGVVPISVLLFVRVLAPASFLLLVLYFCLAIRQEAVRAV